MKFQEAEYFFRTFVGTPIQHFEAFPQSGSARVNYIGKTAEKTYVITQNQNVEENESFFYFTQQFSNLQLNTPKIFSISEDRRLYIQEFLGEDTLAQIIEQRGVDAEVERLFLQSLFQLFELQNRTQGKVDFSKTFEFQAYNELPILHDMNYFKFMFVDVLEVPYSKSRLLTEFYQLAKKLKNIGPRVLMLRDFQSRNIIVDKEFQTFFIDYQSAMEGPAMYDVVSLLYQAKVKLSETFRQQALEYYITLHQEPEVRDQLWRSVLPIRFIRNLQVLGAYGFRGIIQGKNHFLNSIEQGLKNLSQTAETWPEMENYPTLQKLIQTLNSTIVKYKI